MEDSDKASVGCVLAGVECVLEGVGCVVTGVVALSWRPISCRGMRWTDVLSVGGGSVGRDEVKSTDSAFIQGVLLGVVGVMAAGVVLVLVVVELDV